MTALTPIAEGATLENVLAAINRAEVLTIHAAGLDFQVKATRANVPHYLQARLVACNVANWVNAGLTDADREALTAEDADAARALSNEPRFAEYLRLTETDPDTLAARRAIAAAAIAETNFCAEPVTAELLEKMGAVGDAIAEAVANFTRTAASISPPDETPKSGETPPASTRAKRAK